MITTLIKQSINQQRQNSESCDSLKHIYVQSVEGRVEQVRV